ncbi:MAG: S9 family peptidase [Nitrospira sp.]|nr:S9 family peptidase [Nitrospira sp.]
MTRFAMVLCVAVAMVWECPPYALAADPTPVEAFARLPRVGSVKFSPSGKYLAVLRNEDGQTHLVTQSTSGADPHAVVTSDNDDYFIQWFEWVNDGRLLVSIRFAHTRMRVGMVETRLIGVNRDGTGANQELIKPKGPDAIFGSEHYSQIQDQVVAFLPDDPKHILIALDATIPNSPNVYRLNVETGARSLVQANPGNAEGFRRIHAWMADRAGRVRLGIGGRNTMQRIIVRASGSDEWRELVEFDFTKEAGITPLGFDRDPDVLYVRALHDGRQAVFKLRIDQPDAPRELVASDPEYDIGGPLIYSHWLRAVVGVSYAAEGIRTVYWDKRAQAVQARIDSALPNRRNVIVSSSHDGRRHVVASGNAVQPAQYFIFDREHDRVVRFADSRPDVDAGKMAAPKSVTIQARDGLALHGYLTAPVGRDERAMPLVVFPHGGPWARDMAHWDSWAQLFASRGWAVLQVNFRGSSGYGEEFLRAGFQRWGLEMQDDLTDAVQWAIQQGIANANRICIVGASYGGYAALMGAVKTPDLYRCAISVAGLTDLRRYVDERRFFVRGEIAADALIGRWWSDRDRLKDTSPVTHAREIRTPLLLMHGVSDVVVPVEHSREMAEAMKAAGVQNYRYVELPRGDHWLSREPDRLQVFQEMETFLKAHLD